MFAATHFQAMARNNAWSNHRLLKACRELTQDEFEAKRVSFFPSLQLTLNHIPMLAGTRCKPPQLDEFFLAGDAPLREHELKELGL